MKTYIKKKNQVLSEILLDIEKKQGLITAQAVVNVAKNPSSILHERFDWDNSTAGAKYRLVQARQLIKEVTIEWQGESAPGFWGTTVVLEDIQTQGYFSTQRVLSDKQIHKAVLRDAVRELKYWDQKYKEIQELKPVINRRVLEELG